MSIVLAAWEGLWVCPRCKRAPHWCDCDTYRPWELDK